MRSEQRHPQQIVTSEVGKYRQFIVPVADALPAGLESAGKRLEKNLDAYNQRWAREFRIIMSPHQPHHGTGTS
ncbi:MAG TPA: hypothetical protein VFY36_10310 [Solirubrobacteraceae bacterium]|nr:hypothetical protein [Solirubrobacteraceae bacterium]